MTTRLAMALMCIETRARAEWTAGSGTRRPIDRYIVRHRTTCGGRMKITAGLVLFLSLTSIPRLGAAADPTAELQASIALVNDGDFESALAKLDAAIPKLSLLDRAQAYVYRGAAYVG